MEIVAISSKQGRHTKNLRAVFKDLVIARTEFTVQIDFIGSEMSVPFTNGKMTNGNVEQSVRNLLKRAFGSIQYEHQ